MAWSSGGSGLSGTGRLVRWLAVAASLGCGGERADPAIGFAYRFGDTAFEAFLAAEVEGSRPPGGTRIRVVGADTAYREGAGGPLAAEVRRATAFALDPDVLVMVGPGGSRAALQVAPILRDHGLAAIVPNSTSRLLAGAGDNVLLLAPDDSAQGAFIAAFADSVLRARSGLVVHVPDEYGVGLAAGTNAGFAARGMRALERVVVRLERDCRAPEDSAAYAAVADEVTLRGRPDVVVLATRSIETGCLVRALRAREPWRALIAGDGTYLEPEFLDRAGPAAPGTYLVAFWHPSVAGARSRAMAERFRRQVGRRMRHVDAMYVDGVLLAAAAIRAAGPDRASVLRWLRSVGGALRPFEGIAGPVSFARGDPRPLLMTRVVIDSSVVVRR